ncbi:Glycoside hydrolase subgroup catalytic core [Macrophomina phaseolina MS6]|uniref:Glycoside hydrolase subgroup catalytic core n=1 Tax=Macrophomina phaseolina (strain MS6) TaxID=1126212 RepID=K2S4S3_MACPH|nr:Glycoside hydrolase subgroup catalytic core [Macrophomina phaseolina MS6]
MVSLRELIFYSALLPTTLAQTIQQGFNSGNTLPDRTAKFEDDFLKEFETMQKLRNSPGLFNSVRLYTNIQAYTESEPLSAFSAALRTNTSILLGIWCSGTNNITNELDALAAALDRYGTDFANAVIAISVGSEDMYRISESGIRNEAGIGTGPDQIVRFINDTRRAIAGTLLADKPVGHVDTWSAWTNTSNSAVVEAVDWLGVDIYPYFETDRNNTFDRAPTIFEDLFNRTVNASDGKPVWVTETGWPYEGPGEGSARASVVEQEGYWRAVGCATLFGRINTWWYTLKDANPDADEKFAVADDRLSTKPRFDLTCPAGSGAPPAINTTSSGSGVDFAAVALRALIAAFVVGFLLE